MKQENQTETMEPEQAAHLASLEAEATALENSAERQLQEQQEQQVNTLMQENVMAISFMVDMAKPLFIIMELPSVAGVLDQQATSQLAATWGAVATKYGVSLNMIGMAWKEEIAAAMVTWTIGKQIVEAIKKDRPENKKEAKEEAEQT